jgi:hypothetical protein
LRRGCGAGFCSTYDGVLVLALLALLKLPAGVLLAAEE